jgi:hypothetical protein
VFIYAIYSETPIIHFAPNFKLSLRSLIDRFSEKNRGNDSIVRYAKDLFLSLRYIHQIDAKYIVMLTTSAKLYNMASSLIENAVGGPDIIIVEYVF